MNKRHYYSKQQVEPRAIPRAVPSSDMRATLIIRTILLSVMSVKPSSALRYSRSMPNACPARAPHPSGSVFTRGIMSCKRYKTEWRL